MGLFALKHILESESSIVAEINIEHVKILKTLIARKCFSNQLRPFIAEFVGSQVKITQSFVLLECNRQSPNISAFDATTSNAETEDSSRVFKHLGDCVRTHST